MLWRLNRSFLASLVFHAVLFGILFYFVKASDDRAVDLVALTFSDSASVEKFAHGKLNPSKKLVTDVSRFFPNSTAKKSSSDLESTNSLAGSFDNKNSGFENGQSLEGSFTDYPLIQALYERIDQNLEYAGSELDRDAIEGGLDLNLKITSNGQVTLINTVGAADTSGRTSPLQLLATLRK